HGDDRHDPRRPRLPGPVCAGRMTPRAHRASLCLRGGRSRRSGRSVAMGVAARGPAHRYGEPAPLRGASSSPDRRFHRVPRSGDPENDAVRPEAEGRRENMQKLDELDKASLREDVPAFRAGDNVKVHVKVTEGNRSRIQIFQGYVIGRQGHGVGETFRVRKVSFGVGIERVFPVHAPTVDKIEVVTRGDVRRAKLYYLRNLTGKKARIKEKREHS